jgi:hypothetical protein
MVRGVKVALVIFIFIFSIFQAVFIMYESAHSQGKIHAMAVDGSVSICINYPPNITGVCSSNINQSTPIENNEYGCQMSAVTGTGTNLSYSFDNASVPASLHFNINSSGYLTIDSNHSGIGEHIVPIIVRDTSTCSMATTYNYNFTVQDINDPPTLVRLLPSKVIPEGTSIMPFFLNDYFRDLDGDNMIFEVSSSALSISINNLTSLVSISSSEGQCEKYSIYFTATDEHGLSTDSNAVTITMICTTISSDSGGGGGDFSCEPEWQCKDWGVCHINNTQSRFCTDLYACDPNDYERFFWRDCVYTPTCYDEIQNQGELGVDCGGPCPTCSINETEKLPTCDDGIKNQDELGIDCGGSCPACSQIEIPGLLPEQYGNNLMKIVLIIILLLTAMAVTYIIFRKEIKTFAAKISWWLIKRRKKQILIKNNERDELLTAIKLLDEKLKKTDESVKVSDKVFQDFLRISKSYLWYAIKNQSFIEKDVEKALFVVKNNNLKKAMRIFVERHIALETSTDVGLDKYLIMYYMQDLRQIILNTSNYERKNYTFIARALPVEGMPLEECKNLLYNATVALEFTDVKSAKEYYFELLKLYELLDEKGKEMLFYELSKLFNYIRYVLSWK